MTNQEDIEMPFNLTLAKQDLIKYLAVDYKWKPLETTRYQDIRFAALYPFIVLWKSYVLSSDTLYNVTSIIYHMFTQDNKTEITQIKACSAALFIHCIKC